MLRRTLLAGIAAAVVARTTVDAQEKGKLPRVGVLGGAPAVPVWAAFRQELHDLGYVEGRNVIVEWRSWRGGYASLPELAAEFVRLNVNVIVAGASQAALAAKRATDAIPIVTVSGDHVESGLASSVARPEGNVTGVSVLASDLAGKQLDLLVKHVVPRASRVAVLRNPTNPSHPALLRELEASAVALRVQLHVEDARDSKEFDRAISTLVQKHSEAVLVPADPMFYENRALLADLAGKRRLPAMYGSSEYVASGGLMSYGTDRRELYRRLAVYVDKILKGTKPRDLPIEQPRKFELVINLKTAKALGLSIPPSLLLRADHVIE